MSATATASPSPASPSSTSRSSPSSAVRSAELEPRVAVATCAALGDGTPDDRALAAALGGDVVVWDDPAVGWDAYDRVVVRSTWDYTARADAFLRWCAARGAALRNPPEVIAWSADKRYLADVEAAGLPVVPTAFVAPGEAPGALPPACVVKPAVSAGARRTGRFGPDAHDAARALVARITGAGDVALVQPYLEAVATAGETTVVALGGAVSHVLRKRAVLREEGEAPLDLRPGSRGAARVMDDPDLVVPGEATPDELALAGQVLTWLADRFGAAPAYARLDLLPGPDGPLVGEVELVEPNLYLRLSDGAVQRLAAAVLGYSS